MHPSPRLRPAALLLAAALLLPALTPVGAQPVRKDAPAPRAAKPAVAPAAPAAARGRGVDPANVDTTCAACRDFFRFANGGWLKRTTIPAAYPAWGSFNELQDANEGVLRGIVETAAADRAAPTGSNAQKIGAFYRSCMDSAAVERAGVAPLRPTLARIDALATPADVRAALGGLEREARLSPIDLWVSTDDRNSSEMIVMVSQGGLGLPDRDFYLTDDARSREIRDRYLAHVARLLVLGGAPEAQARADAATVLAFETRLARAAHSRVELRDPQANYHRLSVADAGRIAPTLDVARFLTAAGVPTVAAVNVQQPRFLAAVDSMLTSEPVSAWKSYLRFHALSEAAPSLSSAFVNEQFAFWRTFSGASEQLPRWKRCVAGTNDALGELVGQEYVRRTFTPEAKARALAMVENLRAALRDRLEGLTWMSPATKQQALAKLAAFTPKIGYPDRWRDYSALQVADGSPLENRRRVARWNAERDWAKLGKPVDRTEWGMTPPTVNAYYNAGLNEIVFPAGILQPPFYDPEADDAVNYGAMGAVIGHEMTHGFDDEGRQYDAQGNLRDWWTPADAARYDAEAQKVVAQFAGYTVVDSATRVNGKLTLGENIADLGGLTIAYQALQKANENKRLQPIDGFTPDQRFFLGWAQVWRTLQRDEAARAQVTIDPHAPAVWRVNGPLSNMPEFRAAWGCKEGDPMVRPAATQARIW